MIPLSLDLHDAAVIMSVVLQISAGKVTLLKLAIGIGSFEQN
jgi:hypothetical protein